LLVGFLFFKKNFKKTFERLGVIIVSKLKKAPLVCVSLKKKEKIKIKIKKVLISFLLLQLKREKLIQRLFQDVEKFHEDIF